MNTQYAVYDLAAHEYVSTPMVDKEQAEACARAYSTVAACQVHALYLPEELEQAWAQASVFEGELA